MLLLGKVWLNNCGFGYNLREVKKKDEGSKKFLQNLTSNCDLRQCSRTLYTNFVADQNCKITFSIRYKQPFLSNILSLIFSALSFVISQSRIVSQ